MDTWVDRWDGCIDGQTDRKTCERKMEGQTNVWIDGSIWMDGGMAGGREGWIGADRCRSVDRMIDEWID
jgi:hypothetical protein